MKGSAGLEGKRHAQGARKRTRWDKVKTPVRYWENVGILTKTLVLRLTRAQVNLGKKVALVKKTG